MSSNFGNYVQYVTEFLTQNNWDISTSSIYDGIYIIHGTRSVGKKGSHLIAMVVEQPEKQVTTKHLRKLVEIAQEKNADTVILTATVDIAEDVEQVADKYNVNILEKSTIHEQKNSKEDGNRSVEIWNGKRVWISYLFGLRPLFSLILLLISHRPGSKGPTRSHYHVTKENIRAVYGIIRKKETEVKLNNVEKIELSQGFFARFYGYGNIIVYTAKGSDIILKGVNNPNNLKDNLTSIINENHTGATNLNTSDSNNSDEDVDEGWFNRISPNYSESTERKMQKGAYIFGALLLILLGPMAFFEVGLFAEQPDNVARDYLEATYEDDIEKAEELVHPDSQITQHPDLDLEYDYDFNRQNTTSETDDRAVVVVGGSKQDGLETWTVDWEVELRKGPDGDWRIWDFEKIGEDRFF